MALGSEQVESELRSEPSLDFRPVAINLDYDNQHIAEDFLVSDRGRRGITEPIKISPRAVTKKPFVLSRSAGGDRYGH
jgi:hypothetical protein